MTRGTVRWATTLVAALVLITAASPLTLAQIPPVEQSSEPVVVRLYYQSHDQVGVLANEYDVWEVQPEQGYAVILLWPAELKALREQGFRMEIDPERTREARAVTSIPGYPCYRTVEETYTSIQDLAANNPTLAELYDFGDSWDKVTAGGPAGYDLYALRITNENIGGTKPRFFLMAEIHAREYSTAETATRFAEYLLSNYGTNPEITYFVDYNEVYIVPMTNPDGRKFAEGGELWRKNTDNVAGGGCSYPDYGIDLNRNHSFHWGGASNNPCSETYQGPSAGSEPETTAIQNYVLSLFPDQRGPGDTDPAPLDATGMFITLHSYQNWVMWPWGWTSANAPNDAQLGTIGTKLATYNGYAPHQSSDLYPTTGTSDDWAYGVLGIAAFTYEMGTSFFQSCTYFENTLWPGNRNSLLYAFKIPDTPYMTAYGPDTLSAAVAPASVPQGDPAQLTATVSDQYNGNQVVQAAEYYVLPLHGPTPPGDPGTGTAMQPADGNWNSTSENVVATVDTAGLIPGDYIVAARGRDAGSNWGPFTAVFLTVTPGSEPAFVSVAASPLSIPIVYGQSAVTATVTAADGDPVPGATVAFDTDLGTVSPDSAVTDALGRAYTTLLAGDTPGTAHVTAQAAPGVAGGVDVDIYTPDAPVAAFDSNSPVCLGEPVVFENLTSGPPGIPIAYLWDFGDGSTSPDVSPTHVYTAPGTYDVTLTATNVGGSDVAAGTAVVDTVPDAAFSYTPAAPYAGQIVSFTDATTGGPTAWDWDFDDGGTANVQNPEHAFALPGDYTVSLLAENYCGWSAPYEQTVTVIDQQIDGLAAANDSPTVLGSATTLSATVSAGTNVSYVWDPGDGTAPVAGRVITHTYPALGIYTAVVTATNSAGSAGAGTVVTIVSPDEPIDGLAAFNDSPTALGHATTLTATITAGTNVTYVWNLGDGSPPVPGQVISHTYAAPGTYTAIVIATNNSGSASADTIVIVVGPPYRVYLPVVMRWTGARR